MSTKRLSQHASIKEAQKNIKSKCKKEKTTRICGYDKASNNFFAINEELWDSTPQIGAEALIAMFNDKKALIQALKENLLWDRLNIKRAPSHGP